MKQDAKRLTKVIIYGLFVFFLGILLVYSVIYKFPSVFKETITKVEREVTVTDVGIADAIEKVYNSVVIVSNYKGDSVYTSGSGFIYKIDGEDTYLITNYHVIATGDSYKITYSDGSILDATLVGQDQYADIAVLKVQTKADIKAVETGKSDNLRVGDTAFTVGAPLDNTYSWTVTRGIVSGKDRLVEVRLSSATSTDYIMNVLQTDAAVNNGNSGGPLCNSNGEVIGVVNAKISSTGVEGMGFAIPIEVALEKAEQMISGTSSEYPYLGISMLNVENALSYPQYSSYLAESELTKGVIVIDVESNSVADKAKLQKGDIITEINNKDISNIAYLRYELYKYSVGDKIKISYYRDGKEKSVEEKLTSNLKVS